MGNTIWTRTATYMVAISAPRLTGQVEETLGQLCKWGLAQKRQTRCYSIYFVDADKQDALFAMRVLSLRAVNLRQLAPARIH